MVILLVDLFRQPASNPNTNENGGVFVGAEPAVQSEDIETAFGYSTPPTGLAGFAWQDQAAKCLDSGGIARLDVKKRER